MFTGIVEEMGAVLEVVRDQELLQWDGRLVKGFELRIACQTSLVGCTIGCSIAVNGTCLTVTRFDTESFTANLAPETLRRTNLGSLEPGDCVNLERSMQADGRISGHTVQGHVDGTGRLVERWSEGESIWIKVSAPKEIMQQLVPKGFIALDGTSLTLCEVSKDCFTVMLVPHTQRSVVLPSRKIGDAINIETDIIGKFIFAHFQQVADRLDRLESSMEQRLSALEARLPSV